MRILPYKFGSQSAKALSQALGVPRVRHNGQFRNNYRHQIINWGTSQRPMFPVPTIINCFRAVALASNKLYSLRAMSEEGVPTIEHTTDAEKVRQWLEEGHTVMARKYLTSHSGRGIIILQQGDDVVDAPLYTKYFKKKREYRVHVFGGEVLDVQEKRKRLSEESADFRVRNHAGGFVFCREGVEPPQCVLDASIDAVCAHELYFGAVDIGYNERQDTCAVFEVNTAPALEGTTLERYCEAFRRLL